MNNETLSSLIRLLPPARALKEQLEKSLHLEMYVGTGDLAVRSIEGLQASIARLTDDPYVAVLTPQVPEGADDREKVSLALLTATQLVAFLEGQTGLAGFGSGQANNSNNIHYQKAPNVNINDIQGIENMGEVIQKALEMARSEDSGTKA